MVAHAFLSENNEVIAFHPFLPVSQQAFSCAAFGCEAARPTARTHAPVRACALTCGASVLGWAGDHGAVGSTGKLE